jgi:hypothetical protein
MKTINVVVPISVSDCGKYCEEGYGECLGRVTSLVIGARSDLCKYFGTNSSKSTRLRTDENNRTKRCRQCLEAEKKAEGKK